MEIRGIDESIQIKKKGEEYRGIANVFHMVIMMVVESVIMLLERMWCEVRNMDCSKKRDSDFFILRSVGVLWKSEGVVGGAIGK